MQCLAGIADAATRPDPHAHVYYRNKQSLHALVTMSENPRQIPETRTYSRTYATEIATIGSVARHLKCTVTSLRRPSATKGNGKCRSVVLDKDRRNFQEKVRGKTATRHVQEKESPDDKTFKGGHAGSTGGMSAAAVMPDEDIDVSVVQCLASGPGGFCVTIPDHGQDCHCEAYGATFIQARFDLQCWWLDLCRACKPSSGTPLALCVG